MREWLLRQDKEGLVNLLMRQVLKDEDFRRRLLLAVAKERPEGPDLASFYAAVDEAAAVHGFVSYREAHAYASGIGGVIASLRDLITEEHAPGMIELIEYTIAKVEEAIESVDDSDGHMGELLADLGELHHDACVVAGPDPIALAEKLFQRELHGEWNVFAGAAETYADVLGEAGLACVPGIGGGGMAEGTAPCSRAGGRE